MRDAPFLLLQARWPNEPTGDHEHACFAAVMGQPPEALDRHDLTAGPPSLAAARRYRALLIGGAGDFYVSRGNLPHQDRLFTFLRALVAAGVPTFGSCFGYQCLVEALGGEIIHDPAREELGGLPVRLTDAGQADSLLGDGPAESVAQLGHKDRAVRHPEGLPNLAESALSPFQALRVPGKPIWATQFHPELDHLSNGDRAAFYLERAGAPSEQVEATQHSFPPSPAACAILRRFADEAVAGRLR